jgi:glutamine synthetase
MNTLRETVDTIETIVDAADWPMPTYVDLLFGI